MRRLAAVALLLAGWASAGTTTVTVLYSSDIHGHLLPFDEVWQRAAAALSVVLGERFVPLPVGGVASDDDDALDLVHAAQLAATGNLGYTMPFADVVTPPALGLP